MALSRLDIHRRNRGEQTLVPLAGDIGPATTPLLRAAVEQCLLDGVTEIDVDLTTVGSCDARGLDVFLSAAPSGSTPACGCTIRALRSPGSSTPPDRLRCSLRTP
ncbi:STAS domain-containing protein [Streptomyces nigra]|uniref:STAS domain-containing protein n=1 Tax=Streptomyces nigra TaxID=1827580 RepID=UPI0036BA4136